MTLNLAIRLFDPQRNLMSACSSELGGEFAGLEQGPTGLMTPQRRPGAAIISRMVAASMATGLASAALSTRSGVGGLGCRIVSLSRRGSSIHDRESGSECHLGGSQWP